MIQKMLGIGGNTGGSIISADKVSFDPTATDLEATDVQSAIEEVNSNFDSSLNEMYVTQQIPNLCGGNAYTEFSRRGIFCTVRFDGNGSGFPIATGWNTILDSIPDQFKPMSPIQFFVKHQTVMTWIMMTDTNIQINDWNIGTGSKDLYLRGSCLYIAKN